MQPRTLTASQRKHIPAKVPDLLDRMKAETLQKVVSLLYMDVVYTGLFHNVLRDYKNL